MSALLWRVVAAKYWRSGLGGAIGCEVWKGICKGMDSFFRFTGFKINNGEIVSFWQDPWCEREPLCTLFPECYGLAVDKHGSVKDHMIRSRVFCS